MPPLLKKKNKNCLVNSRLSLTAQKAANCCFSFSCISHAINWGTMYSKQFFFLTKHLLNIFLKKYNLYLVAKRHLRWIIKTFTERWPNVFSRWHLHSAIQQKVPEEIHHKKTIHLHTPSTPNYWQAKLSKRTDRQDLYSR